MIIHGIVLFDLSAMMAMLVIASLSKTIGEAQRIAAYYKLLYVTSLIVCIAAFTDSLPYLGLDVSIVHAVAMGLRFIAGCIALPVCLRYWKWVISEYFKN